MPLFFVRWDINIEADNALEAARQAREIQTRPGTSAVVFDVWAGYQPRGVPITVDLNDVALDEDATTTATGSAYWASYFINGDASGLTDAEQALADAWLARLGDWYVVDVAREDDGEAQEPRFTWAYGLHTGSPASGGDVLDYVIAPAT